MRFATEGLFIKLATHYNQIEEREDGTYFSNPYKTMDLNRKTLNLKPLNK